jgi:aminodeoxyfutalosine deaminase
MPGDVLRPFVQALPKVELHVHLVGSASVDTVLALAQRHSEAGVPTDRAELERFYTFRDFQGVPDPGLRRPASASRRRAVLD